MKTSNVLIGTALTAAVGYAIADGLARACTYAEEVENDDCSTRSTAGSGAALSAVHQPELPAVTAPPRSLLHARAGQLSS